MMKVKTDKIRVDKYMASEKPEFTRSKIQKLIKSNNILVNGKPVKSSFVLKKGDNIEIKEIKEEPKDLKKENIKLKIIYENKDYLVIEKPEGIVVHPSETGKEKGTVVSALLDKIGENVGQENRPGIVHRLDKDTSGLLLVAKTKKAYEYFVKMFKERKIKKTYIALVKGRLLHKEGIIDSPINRDIKNRKKMGLVSEKEGKRAITKYIVKKEFNNESLLEVQIETGRTHQIRVHMAAIGHPVIGDNTYGIGSLNRKYKNETGLGRQFLHAEKLEFIDLDNKKKKFESELPEKLKNVLTKL